MEVRIYRPTELVKLIFSDNDEHHPVLSWSPCDFGAVYKHLKLLVDDSVTTLSIILNVMISSAGIAVVTILNFLKLSVQCCAHLLCPPLCLGSVYF